MRFRIRTFRRRRRRQTKRGRGLAYVKNNRVYFGRGNKFLKGRTLQRGDGVLAKLLAKAIPGAGFLIGT